YYVIYPAAIITGMMNLVFEHTLIIFPITYIITGVFIVHIAEYLGRKMKIQDSKLGAIIISLPIINSGVVYSVGYLIGGNDGLLKMVMYTIGDIIVIPYSQLVASKYSISLKGAGNPISYLVNPINLAILLGLVLNLFNLTIPDFLLNPIQKLSEMITPIVMIGLGLSVNLKGYFNEFTAGLVIIKNILSIIIALIVSQIFNLDRMDSMLLISAGVSSLGFVGTVLSKQVGFDYTLSATLNFISIISLFVSLIFLTQL
ncbi:MAG: hypothetical protein NZ908_03030, partial [Candidatus Micrarchaeota archaeon]|nr:hypothetical protein [Candidatus Micrarchaeota archaeon]